MFRTSMFRSSKSRGKRQKGLKPAEVEQKNCLTVTKVVQETDKALKVTVYGNDIWLPKSLIEGECPGRIEIPNWLFKKKENELKTY